MGKNSLSHVYIGVLLVSVSTLMLQIALTRIFSISQYYHFAFMVVSIAFLGFAASGTLLSIKQSLIDKEVDSYLGSLSLLYSASVIISFILTQEIPFDPYMIAWDTYQLLYIALYYILLAIPFLISGLIIGLVIARIPRKVSEVYFHNMVGSGFGSLVLVYLSFILAVEDLVVAVSLVALLASLVFSKHNMHRITSYSTVLLLIAIVLIQPHMDIKISPYKSLNLLLNHPHARLISTEWNPFSRVDLIASEGVRYFPGLSLNYRGDIPEQYGITVDGDSLNAVSLFDGNKSKIKFVEFLPAALPYEISPREKVLVINPRGGLDLLVSLYYNSSEITAVEANPSIIELVALSNISGGLYESQGLFVEVNEGRSFIKRSQEHYDLIVLAVRDDVLSSSTGLYSLSEDYLHTSDAFTEYFEHLSGDGVILVTRWLHYPPRELPRMVSMVVSALEESNVEHAEEHLIVIRGYTTFTLLVKKSPFSNEEIKALRAFTDSRNFDLVYVPGITEAEINKYNKFPEPVYYELTINLLDSEGGSRIISEYLYDITPPSDDRPFYSSFFRIDKIIPLYESMGERWEPFFEGGFLSFFVLFQAAVLTLILVFLPLFYYQRITLHVEGKSIIAYFFLIGLAYMFVEISMIQKFILFLGQPIYSVSVIIASLLISSGFGSLLSGRFQPQTLKSILFIIPILLLSYLLFLPYAFNSFLGSSLFIRAMVSALLLFPLGFVMGMPFPLGIRISESIDSRLVPWGWCSNLSASVLSSILAASIALYYGFSSVVLISSLAYLLCLLLIVRGFSVLPLSWGRT